MSRPTVLVFLKAPVPGQVKTRLAASLGPERAAELYRGWIDDTFAKLQPLRESVRVVGFYDGPEPADWAELADVWRPQPAGDLGTRLAAGFEASGDMTVAIGTDCPELEPGLIRQAIDELARHDAVFGPCPDGGYYLVGLERPLPGFFTGIRWSSPHTLADHLARCRREGWSVALLPERHDIDTGDDWSAYLERGGRHPHVE